jgi:hypothetical protein
MSHASLFEKTKDETINEALKFLYGAFCISSFEPNYEQTYEQSLGYQIFRLLLIVQLYLVKDGNGIFFFFHDI